MSIQTLLCESSVFKLLGTSYTNLKFIWFDLSTLITFSRTQSRLSFDTHVILHFSYFLAPRAQPSKKLSVPCVSRSWSVEMPHSLGKENYTVIGIPKHILKSTKKCWPSAKFNWIFTRNCNRCYTVSASIQMKAYERINKTTYPHQMFQLTSMLCSSLLNP